MKKLKQILAIAMVAMMAVVFMPVMPGVNGEASADVDWTRIGSSDCQYKIETSDSVVTLTIAPTNGESGTLPDNYTLSWHWPWTVKDKITKVVISGNVKAGNSTAYMFAPCYLMTTIEGLSKLDTSNVTNMSYMFNGCYKLIALDLSNFNTSNVTDMTSMFRQCNALTTPDLTSFNTSSVESMKDMFNGCSAVTTFDLSSFDTSNVTNMSDMFINCRALETILTGRGWSTDNVTNSGDMFKNCWKLVGGAGTACDGISNIDATYARIDGGPTSETPGYFTSGENCNVDGTSKYYSTLDSAVKAVGDGQKIVILNDLKQAGNLTIEQSKNLTIDLNGKTINLDNHHIICHGQLTITDSSENGTGKITGGSPTTEEIEKDPNNNIGGAVAITKQENTAEFTLAGGAIENCSAQDGGAVFVGEGAKFLMSGGTINDCSATLGGAVYNYCGTAIINSKISNCTAKDYGGAIYNENIISGEENSGRTTVNANANITGCSAKDGTGMMGGGIFNKGTLRMNGGTISGCSAAKGAGVHNDGTSDKVTFELNDGKIENNTAVQNGGGIQNSANAVLTINGGSITGNKATNNYGGGVFSAETLNFGNAAKITITENKGTTTEVNSNVAFASGKTGTVTSETLASDSSIGVMAIKKYSEETVYNLTESEVITSFTDAENSFFTSDDEDYELKLDTDKIKFQRKAAVKGTGTVTGGTVSINPETPSAGTEVTITATPDSGYEVGTITVTDKQGNSITVTDGKFTMPTNEYLLPVTISANFTKYEPTPSPSPSPDPSSDYTVTFDNQGHGVVPQSQAIEEGGKVSDPGSLTAEGYNFGGWFTDKACTDAWDFDNDTVTKDITLYAKWTEESQPAEAKEALMATGTAKKATNTIKWNAVEGADGYDVYYAKCGNNLKKVKSTTALKYTKKSLNKKKYYKYRVKAYETVDGNKVYLSTSPVVHIAGVSAKYSNATKVTADPDGIFFEVGDTDKITAKITKKSSNKTVLWKNHVSAKIRYMSTDSSVVTVDSKGNVTAIDKGEAYVYAYAASGAFAKITVTVQ